MNDSFFVKISISTWKFARMVQRLSLEVENSSRYAGVVRKMRQSSALRPEANVLFN